MGTVFGGLINAVLVHGLRLLERAYPMPKRLGAELAAPAPSTADPVILVGGYANSPAGWSEWKRSLEADGFQVFVFDLPSRGLGDMHESAALLAAYIEEVRGRTGRRKVDVVGFSEGGLLNRMVAAYHGGAGSIDRMVSLATPHGGVPARGLYDALRSIPLLGPLLARSVPELTEQLIEGSSLLSQLDTADRALRLANGASGGPRYASVYSRVTDILVTPMAGWLDGAVNVPVRRNSSSRSGPNHFEMYHTSHRAYEAARLLLLDSKTDAVLSAGFLDAPAQG